MEKAGKIRIHRREILLADGEKIAIADRARACGLSEAAYIRMTALGVEIPVRKTAIEAETVAALNRIGANINQIAKVGNSSGSLTPDQVKVLIATHQGLTKIAGRINQAVTA